MGVMSEVSLRTRAKFEVRSFNRFFKLLAFNAEKFRGSLDPGYALFGKIVGGNVRTVPGNTSVKFQVRSFNRF